MKLQSMKPSTKIEVGQSTLGGRGVFASRNITIKEVIEDCPLLILPANEEWLIKETELYNYYFKFDDNNLGIALGYGSLYNHSSAPNAQFVKDLSNKRLIVQPLRYIPSGEEILVNYMGDNSRGEKVWFEESVSKGLK
ncbi:MAG: SET domain-containing protein [Candidatus Nanoarchaeia archaeon]